VQKIAVAALSGRYQAAEKAAQHVILSEAKDLILSSGLGRIVGLPPSIPASWPGPEWRSESAAS
jgi:hypothetical protein